MSRLKDQREGTTVTKHTPGDHARVCAAIERIRKRAAKLKRVRFDWDALKADRDAGRP